MEKFNTNTALELMVFFSIPGEPVYLGEFLDFWNSLNEDEQFYYWTADLK